MPRIETLIEISEVDLEWCYMRATRIRVPLSVILADMISLGIAMRDESEAAEDAAASKNELIVTPYSPLEFPQAMP
jgi:hypothetical protein